MSLENSENLENKVFKKADNDELIFCDWKDCSELGQYIRCYFDISTNCPKYVSHQRHLKYIRGLMKKEKRRHHPRI